MSDTPTLKSILRQQNDLVLELLDREGQQLWSKLQHPYSTIRKKKWKITKQELKMKGLVAV